MKHFLLLILSLVCVTQCQHPQGQALFVRAPPPSPLNEAQELQAYQDRVSRQSKVKMDQTVQGILKWLQGRYNRTRNTRDDVVSRKYLPASPSTTQKPRPFQTSPSPPLAGYQAPSQGVSLGYPSFPQAPSQGVSLGYPSFPQAPVPTFNVPSKGRPVPAFNSQPLSQGYLPYDETFSTSSQTPLEQPSDPDQPSLPMYPPQPVEQPSAPDQPSLPMFQPPQPPEQPSAPDQPPQPTYQPSIPSQQPTYQPSVPTYQPFQPSYQPLVTSQQPTYQPSVPTYQPPQPSYQPSIPPQQPTYQTSKSPSSPSYQPAQPPSGPSYEPSQPPSAPSYQPSQPSAPSAPTYQPSSPTKPSAPSQPAYEPEIPIGPSAPQSDVSDNTIDGTDSHPPHIHAIDVQCAKDMMTINIEFDRAFNGIIYSKGYRNTPECVFVGPNSNKVKFSITVMLNTCGTQFVDQFSEGKQAYLENVLVLQNDETIQEVWDTTRSVRCYWEGTLKKQLSVALSVDSLSQETVTFSGDTATARLDIQVGRGPFAPAANGLVKIGETMTLVVTVEGDSAFNVLVRDCIARDNDPNSGNIVQLTDESGCVLKPKLLGAFQMTQSTETSSVIAYAFFQAFKFPDVMDLTIECNVELCKTECAPCLKPDQKIEPGRRKRSIDNSTISLVDPISVGRKFRVYVPEDIEETSPAAPMIVNVGTPISESYCLSSSAFLVSTAMLVCILVISCISCAVLWLKLQRQYLLNFHK